MESEFTRLREQYGITEEQAVDATERGEYRRCGAGRRDGESVVVCTWADHGSLATALFTRLSVQDSADLLTDLRAGIVRREPWGR
ncbi:hypothetical protein [Plantactinospora sp. CA-290183]|uniref:hypothetical protein n=1 Tax=Plantactinospora sp. CA-290183 TaxID=3240006 RepID=UPI003D8BECA2